VSQKKYLEPEFKVEYPGIDKQTSSVDFLTVKFLIMSQILAANCVAALSAGFQD
jgi:hypothetical protein